MIIYDYVVNYLYRDMKSVCSREQQIVDDALVELGDLSKVCLSLSRTKTQIAQAFTTAISGKGSLSQIIIKYAGYYFYVNIAYVNINPCYKELISFNQSADVPLIL